ncbi:MAG: hypothetical protein NC207_07370 [Bacteroides sp.]|nr:hypothetical protein [Bacteroides sp.]
MKFLPILMTASISTRGMVGACFSDEERYRMYLGTLHYYINEFFIDKHMEEVRLVFVDNSGWDLSQLKGNLADSYGLETVSENVEFLSLEPEWFDVSKGKGYNELLMINIAVERSRFIGRAGAFFKVTGRYPIYNLGYFHTQAFKAMKEGVSFYCDIKDHNLYKYLGLNWNSHSFEARLWGSKVDFYKQFIAPEYMNCYDYDGRFVESVLFNKFHKPTNGFKFLYINNITGGGKISVRFGREPSFGGLEGSDSNSASFSKDQQSLKGKAKRFIGNCFRIFLPFIKF